MGVGFSSPGGHLLSSSVPLAGRCNQEQSWEAPRPWYGMQVPSGILAHLWCAPSPWTSLASDILSNAAFPLTTNLPCFFCWKRKQGALNNRQGLREEAACSWCGSRFWELGWLRTEISVHFVKVKPQWRFFYDANNCCVFKDYKYITNLLFIDLSITFVY